MEGGVEGRIFDGWKTLREEGLKGQEVKGSYLNEHLMVLVYLIGSNGLLLDTKEELLLKERGRGGLFPPPLPLDDKTVAHRIGGRGRASLPAHLHLSQASYLNKSISCLSFVSSCIPSTWRHEETEPQ